MNKKRCSWQLALVLTALLLAVKLHYGYTQGFRVDKVLYKKMAALELGTVAPLPPVLDQPFFYLGRGRQAYVFVSAD